VSDRLRIRLLGELDLRLGEDPLPPLVPPEQYGRPVLGLMPEWAGDPGRGRRALAPLRRVGRPVADNLRPLP
jgi:hypothetical protein